MLKKAMVKFLLISAGIIMLASCAPKMVTVGYLGSFKQGDDVSNLKGADLQEPNLVFNYNDIKNAGKIEVYIYEALIKKDTGYMVFLPVSSGTYYYFAFAYQNNKLLYWGYADDFLKADNELVRKIGEKISESVKNS